MLHTYHALADMLGSAIAFMALLAVAYGLTIRRFPWTRSVRMLLGALFGAAAALAMVDPLSVTEGVLVDLRHVPLVLAGAFLGGPGALMAILIAVAVRLGIGGTGMVPGAIGVLVSCLAGLAWPWLLQRYPCRRRYGIVLLAPLSLAHLPDVLLMPWDVAWLAVTTVWPILVPFQIAGVLATAALLERERVVASTEQRLAQAAVRDPLTGLLNRRGFEAAVARLPLVMGGSAVLLLDLDHFKRINDQHGHAAGDAVLQALDARLCRALRGEDVMARFGGEEVIVFLHDLEPHSVKAAAEQFCEAMRCKPFVLPDGRTLHVTVSVGAAWTGGRVRLDKLTAHADAALYAAKKAGRDGWCLDAYKPAADASFETAHAPRPHIAA